MQIVTRTSNRKIILDDEHHRQLLPKYIQIIAGLVKDYPIVNKPEFKELVSFKRNRDLSIHRWFDYKHGYSDELVKKLIALSTSLEKNDYILDPFVGTGTTLVTAQSLGLKSIGLDINPVASFSAGTKTYLYSKKDLDEIDDIINNIERYFSRSASVPKYLVFNDIFTEGQLEQVLRIKGLYENIQERHISDFFKLSYLSIIEDCSNRIKDGNGIKISRTKKPVKDVYQYFVNKCRLMLWDLKCTTRSTDAVVISGSILQDAIFEQIKGLPIGSIIFSPPYANCFDYCEVYKMEIWLGDFVKDYSDFKKYRDLAIRSHVNSKFDPTIKNLNEEVDVIAALIGTYNVWNKNIPRMIKGYFDDMHETLSRLYAIGKPNSICAIAVANSGYKGITVPTDLLLARIAERIGYRVQRIIVARQIRASSQQIKELREQGNLMRESIIILQR